MKLKYLGVRKPVFEMSFLLEGPYDFSKSNVCEVGDADAKVLMARNPKTFEVVETDDEAEVPFICEVCGKEYKQQHFLDKHMETKHPDHGKE